MIPFGRLYSFHSRSELQVTDNGSEKTELTARTGAEEEKDVSVPVSSFSSKDSRRGRERPKNFLCVLFFSLGGHAELEEGTLMCSVQNC